MTNAEQLRKRRDAAVSRGVSSVIGAYVERASGATLIDVDGREWIDFGSGIAVTSVGNSAPQVVDAVTAQVRQFTHTCFMVAPYESYVAVCEQLNAVTPGAHDKRSVLFNSGAEAVENAVKIARYATGRLAVVVFDHAYHGRTNLTMALTAKNMPYKHRFGPLAGEVYRAPMSYPLRDGGRSGAEAAALALNIVDRQVGANNVAAVLIEPIQGEGGFVVPAPGFLPALAQWAAANGALLIADEIQTGFCRTGDWFACEHESVIPDLVATAKALGGGLPLAGVTGRTEVMDSVHPGGLGGTYGGNPVACAAALAAIDTMRELDLCAAARRIETLMVPRLAELSRRHAAIAEVRGRGAMLAIELVQPDHLAPDGAPAPDTAAAAAIAKACHDAGLLVLTCGTFGNVVRFLPPLVIDEPTLHRGLELLETAIDSALSPGEHRPATVKGVRQPSSRTRAAGPGKSAPSKPRSAQPRPR